MSYKIVLSWSTKGGPSCSVLYFPRFDEPLALEKGILARFSTQEGFQHVHAVHRATSL